MPTRNVVLTDHQSALIDRLVASGRYQNASEAMRAGLRLLEEDESQLHALHERLQRGLREAETGATAPGTGEEAVHGAAETARQRVRSGG
ncbi:hypothetical protein OG2516_15599 [Oceanicola granulosus HTCC2516]|uniref:Type II toxin-antitoxin system ParD family antitoxin n=1 Tax=Oceanicola granulosus (strain ATCC BAA-861 / DSM 15982 / KCTC 12143 / HTCC2516) TaxID=314256 RepID=Q2CF93_OCEGH|nr:type II toxin-antitoxin system ParD family antitoxin [Oceanicola granulosus]EAR51402.1 hypothetical protein OG2516_15599 [Oceanicola granulosus HTCC2516]